MPDYSLKKTVMDAFAVCMGCSILVYATAVSLHGIQEENRKPDLKKLREKLHGHV